MGEVTPSGGARTLATMIRIRLAEDRGHFDHGWLDTYHSFSFGGYMDPDHVQFRALRVLNEDVVHPGRGFGTHPHQDMEIVTVILAGALEHKDSTGTGSVIRPGDVQRMSAGTGILHSEFNPSPTEPVHLLQIWLLPNERGLAPSYEEQRFGEGAFADGLRLVAAPDGRDGALTIHSAAELRMGSLADGQGFTHAIAPNRHVYLHVATGSVRVTGTDGVAHELGAGSAAAVSEESELRVEATTSAQVLVFDLE